MTVFVELWKRYHAELAYKWNVLGYEPDEEVIRPEYQYYKRAKMKINRVTKEAVFFEYFLLKLFFNF